MDFDFSIAAKTDDLSQTIDYFAVCQRLRQWGADKTWKLIERIACEVADLVIAEFHAEQVAVEIKKFVLSETDYVSAQVTRRKPALP